ncbi:uncharacterized protein PGTG_15546 [Puccinia graminis f. sp. tritici CRL 75-36-700-3]|uniref:Uncharacterized protein n=1 Tax=Puccinia graminis f. sp. tritici (strain CRL 75-36-700-3 / race SCCL) TaxID=418459 RepID=E3KYH6_PUCGT|nr:uncharacterized protein PGTG_15546 [Puccinia graminis f. sp. tritici CRL 75-36-700-3]EFP89367.2 hypothetical protein PGTG_15546 [Puccinia graminis f. sp. tritici CRL 75-36-700-3]
MQLLLYSGCLLVTILSLILSIYTLQSPTWIRFDTPSSSPFQYSSIYGLTQKCDKSNLHPEFQCRRFPQVDRDCQGGSRPDEMTSRFTGHQYEVMKNNQTTLAPSGPRRRSSRIVLARRRLRDPHRSSLSKKRIRVLREVENRRLYRSALHRHRRHQSLRYLLDPHRQQLSARTRLEDLCWSCLHSRCFPILGLDLDPQRVQPRRPILLRLAPLDQHLHLHHHQCPRSHLPHRHRCRRLHWHLRPRFFLFFFFWRRSEG